jgi:hypothetical protein
MGNWRRKLQNLPLIYAPNPNVPAAESVNHHLISGATKWFDSSFENTITRLKEDSATPGHNITFDVICERLGARLTDLVEKGEYAVESDGIGKAYPVFQDDSNGAAQSGSKKRGSDGHALTAAGMTRLRKKIRAEEVAKLEQGDAFAGKGKSGGKGKGAGKQSDKGRKGAGGGGNGGKGKQAGGGTKASGSNYFEGYCDYCWKWGHRFRDCWERSKGFGKGKAWAAHEDSYCPQVPYPAVYTAAPQAGFAPPPPPPQYVSGFPPSYPHAGYPQQAPTAMFGQQRRH